MPFKVKKHCDMTFLITALFKIEQEQMSAPVGGFHIKEFLIF